MERTGQHTGAMSDDLMAAALSQIEADLRAVLLRAGLSAELAGPVLRGEAQGLPDRAALALIALDPQGVQHTILASRKIVTRLGASTAFAAWDQALRDRRVRALADLPHVVLYAGGGNAVLIAARDDATTLEDRLRTAFQARDLGPLSVAGRDCSPLDLVRGPAEDGGLDRAALERLGIRTGGGGFSGLLTQLHTRLSLERDAPRPGARRTGQRCAECGSRDASTDLHGEPVCAICKGHHDAGAALRKIDGIPDSIEDFDSGELAWLYLDGTQVGRALRRCASMRQYIQFSASLLHAFDWSLVRADLRAAGVGEAIPLVRGGDDVGMVFDATIGEGAFSASLSVLEGLARRARALQLSIGAGAGLVVSKSLGARQAWNLAKQLVRRAKDRAPDDGGYALDLEIVDGGDVLGERADTLRPDRWQRVALPPQGWTWNRLELTTRPWTLTEARDLHTVFQRIDAQMPDGFSTLRRAGAALREDLYKGLSFSRHALERQRSADGEQNLWALLGGGDGMPRPNSNQGWILRPGQDANRNPCWRTAIPDLVELERLHRGVSHG